MNLDPDKRTNFLDLLRPPSGYRLAQAVGTTYSMDFVGLTSVLLAFVDAEADNESERLNPVELLRAIIRLQNQVRVFVSRGRITEKDISRHGKLSSLFDRIVHEVTFDEGCFHPKVWVARYEPRATAEAAGLKPVLRIICASRNLTQGSRWEIFAAFEGLENGNKDKNSLAREISAFLGKVKQSAEEGDTVVSTIQAALTRVQIELPRQMSDGCHFNWQWNGAPPLWKVFPQRGTQALIVSPFVRANILSPIVNGYDRLTLVSSQAELDALSEDFYAKLKHKAEIFVVNSAVAEDDSPAMQLHAKLFICETLSDRTVLLGSANASQSAWQSRNCEAVVSYSPGLSIEQFRKSFIFSPKSVPGETENLRGWIERYDRQPVVEDEITLAEKELDRLQNLLIGMEFTASYSPQLQLLRFQCPALGGQPELATLVAQHRLRLCPLSRFERDANLVDASGLLSQGIEFNAIRILDLTEFIVLEISHPATDPKQFIVKAKANFLHLRDQRDADILDEYLTPESFRNFLRAILFDGVSRGIVGENRQSKRNDSDGIGWTLLGEITLEEIIQSCTEDSSRMVEIDQLMRVFAKTKAADSEFVQFQEFWDAFQAAHAETMELTHG